VGSKQPKISSAEPVVRGHQSQSSNILSSGPNVKASPYQAGLTNPKGYQPTSQFQQYVIAQGSQNQQQPANSRNQVLKSGIGAKLNTKNNNAFLSGGVPANRQNTQASFQG
jgi:hypothetical protein